MAATPRKKAVSSQRRASATATTVLVVSYNPRMVKPEAIAQTVRELHGVTTVNQHQDAA